MNDRSRRTLVVSVVLLVCLLVAGAATAVVGFRTPPREYSALFTQTVGLYVGSDVRVLGVKVGSVTAVEPEGAYVRVDMEVDADVDLAADTDAVIVAPTLVSDRYVQLTEPWGGGEKLASGAVLDTDRTAVPLEVDDLYASVDEVARLLGPDGANRDGALSRLVTTGARNLKGNGPRVRQVVRDLGDASRTLVTTGEDTFESIDNLDELAEVLADNDQGVDDATVKMARVTRLLADDREVLSDAITLLSGAMVDLEDFLRDNRGNITRSVRGLTTVTETLVRRKEALSRVLGVTPVLLQNVLNSYDSRNRLFTTRGNPNDVTIWGNPVTDLAGVADDSASGLMLGDGSLP